MDFKSRGVQARLETALRSQPVVVLEGARATGKTSLAHHLIQRGILNTYRTFAQSGELTAAGDSPSSYVQALPSGTVIDEAQLHEQITVAVKTAVDADTAPGRFLLTGSTRLRRNALGGSDPLAGRTGTPISLWPMTIGEREGVPVHLVEQLFAPSLNPIAVGRHIDRAELATLVTRSGLPALHHETRTPLLYDQLSGYVHDVTALKSFAGRDVQALDRFVRYVAGRTGAMVNVSEFARKAQVSRTSADEYLALLVEALLVRRIEAWRISADKSATSTAKLHFFDTGAAAALGRLTPNTHSNHLGQLVETLATNELATQASWMHPPPAVYHWRSGRDEVDLVLEAPDGKILCVKVKTSDAVDPSTFHGIRAFRRKNPARSVRGIVLYTGATVLPFADDNWAVPFGALAPTPTSATLPANGPTDDTTAAEETAAAVTTEFARQLRLMAQTASKDAPIVRTPPSLRPTVGVVELQLTSPDGREVLVSVGHETTNNQTVATVTVHASPAVVSQPDPQTWTGQQTLAEYVSHTLATATTIITAALGPPSHSPPPD